MEAAYVRWLRALGAAAAILAAGCSAAAEPATGSGLAANQAEVEQAGDSESGEGRQPFRPIESFSFADATHGWLSIGNQILATEDGGETWTPVHTTAESNQMFQVQRLDEQAGWYSSDDGLFKTEDAGRTWNKIIEEGFLYGRFQFTDANRGWILPFRGGLMTTPDGGETWVEVTSPCDGGPFSFLDAMNGWIVCPTGGGAGIETKQLFRTWDGGASWSLLADTGHLGGPKGTMPLSSWSRDLFFLDLHHGWLTTAKGDLLTTADGGLTWQRLPPLGDVTVVAEVQFLTPEHGYIIATEQWQETSRLLTTHDGGQTWHELFRVSAD